MSSPQLPFRVCLGEHQGQHSLVVHSAKGIEWLNVPPELEVALKRITTRDILELALGSQGRFFLRYREGPLIKQVVAAKVSTQIQSHIPGFQGEIMKVSFGHKDEMWAKVKQSGIKQQQVLVQVRPKALKILNPSGSAKKGPQIAEFVALGSSADNFVMKVGNQVSLGGHGGVRGGSKGKKGKQKANASKNNTIIAATLSPVDNCDYVVTFADGSYRLSLAGSLGKIVKQHLEPNNSLLRAQVAAPSSASPLVNPVVGSSRTLSTSRSSELRLLDPGNIDYKRIQGSFYEGWKHPQKAIPDLRYIYEVTLPQRLAKNYSAYRLKILNSVSPIDLGEQELFHGTSRRCMLGNEPELNEPCKNTSCRLCCIVTGYFAIAKAGTADGRVFLRFGRGIYTSSVSSKADDYTVTPPGSGYRAMLVARIVLGKGYPLKVTTSHLTGPPSGYHSVIGEVGSHLNYDEQVVYKNEAARPAYLIIYKL